MRVLYVINTGLVGGLQQHVLTLMRALKGVAETAVVLNAILDEKVVSMFEDAGMKVYRLDGKSGHDWRIVGRFRKVLADFRPDVIHAHGLPLLVAVDLLVRRMKFKVLYSLHTPSARPTLKKRVENFVLDRLVDYWLPVSGPTWEMFRRWHPHAKGEVFFNPLYLADFPPPTLNFQSLTPNPQPLTTNHQPLTTNPQPLTTPFTIGMVGRNAVVKDWPSFHRVEAIVKEKLKLGVEVEDRGRKGGEKRWRWTEEDERRITANWFDVIDPIAVREMRCVRVSQDVDPLTDRRSIKDVFQGFGEVENCIDGRRVIFPAKSAGKMLAQSGIDIRRYVRSFANMFRKSIRAWSETEAAIEAHKQHRNITAYHQYVVKAKLDELDCYVRFTIREDAGGKSKRNEVHSSTVSRVTVYKAKGAELSILGHAQAEDSTPFVDKKIAYFFCRVNGDSSWSLPIF